MSGKSNIRNLGRAILVGSVAGLSLGSCQVPAGSMRPPVFQSTQRTQAYNEALTTRSPRLVTDFVRTYRGSADSATLLNQMPNNVLAQIPRSAVAGLDGSVKQRLTPRVRGQFGISLAPTQTTRDTGGGYSG